MCENTGRLMARDGGADIGRSPCTPRLLIRFGCIGTRFTARKLFPSSLLAGTLKAALPTGREFMTTSRFTATTPPGARRFA
jgi:hypothetical protein